MNIIERIIVTDVIDASIFGNEGFYKVMIFRKKTKVRDFLQLLNNNYRPEVIISIKDVKFKNSVKRQLENWGLTPSEIYSINVFGKNDLYLLWGEDRYVFLYIYKTKLPPLFM